MDSLNMLVVILAVIGGCLVSDVGSLRSRAAQKKAERDASLTGVAGSWVGSDAGADALARRYNVQFIVGGWIFIACAVGVFLVVRVMG
jgi:hypothetical protein